MKQPFALILAALASGAAVMAILWRVAGGSEPAPTPEVVRQPAAEVPVRLAPAAPSADRAPTRAGAAPALPAQVPPPPKELLDAIRRAQATAPRREAASAPVQPALSFEEAIAIARARQRQTPTVVTNPFGPPQK